MVQLWLGLLKLVNTPCIILANWHRSWQIYCALILITLNQPYKEHSGNHDLAHAHLNSLQTCTASCSISLVSRQTRVFIRERTLKHTTLRHQQ